MFFASEERIAAVRRMIVAQVRLRVLQWTAVLLLLDWAGLEEYFRPGGWATW